MRRQLSVGVVVASTGALLVPFGGCSVDLSTTTDRTDSAQAPRINRRSAPRKREQPAPKAPPSHCHPGVPECRAADGLIIYVERVDPDGDGDAHFVIADSQSITLPGMTAIDVEQSLRPDPLPGPGDTISAAGPVQTGSYGQSQIHALELHVAGAAEP